MYPVQKCLPDYRTILLEVLTRKNEKHPIPNNLCFPRMSHTLGAMRKVRLWMDVFSLFWYLREVNAEDLYNTELSWSNSRQRTASSVTIRCVEKHPEHLEGVVILKILDFMFCIEINIVKITSSSQRVIEFNCLKSSHGVRGKYQMIFDFLPNTVDYRGFR